MASLLASASRSGRCCLFSSVASVGGLSLPVSISKFSSVFLFCSFKDVCSSAAVNSFLNISAILASAPLSASGSRPP